MTAYEENGILPYSTIRHNNCEFLQVGAEKRCRTCTRYRGTLRSTKSNHLKISTKDRPTSRIAADSHVNYRFLRNEECIARCHKIHVKYRNVLRKLARLRTKLSKSIDTNGILVDKDTHNDLSTIVEDSSSSADPENSFAKIFWEHQKKAASLTKSSSMRWHPLLIKWALYLRHQSSKAYEVLRES